MEKSYQLQGFDPKGPFIALRPLKFVEGSVTSGKRIPAECTADVSRHKIFQMYRSRLLRNMTEAEAAAEAKEAEKAKAIADAAASAASVQAELEAKAEADAEAAAEAKTAAAKTSTEKKGAAKKEPVKAAKE